MSLFTTNSLNQLPRSARSRVAIFVMDLLLGVSGLAAVACLILWYGFREPPVSRENLLFAQLGIVGIFILDRGLRLVLARRRWQYFKDNWVDFALMVVMGAAMGISYHTRPEILSAGALYVFISQAYLLIALILRGVSVNLRLAGSGIDPAWLLIGSFLLLVFGGSGLLMLPAATPLNSPILYYDDALFTATSATCVTGLTVRTIGPEGFTLFGQAVILLLIQLGGLGIMLFGTVLALVMGKGLSLRGSSAIGQMLGTESNVGQLGHIAKFVVAMTLAIEAVGAALFYPMFREILGPAGLGEGAGPAIWYSVFHSVSAFCNAGLTLFNQNFAEGIGAQAAAHGWAQPIREHWQMLGVLSPLIVIGGLGFPVLYDLWRWGRGFLFWLSHRLSSRRRVTGVRRPRLTLHSRIVLSASAFLIVAGALVLLALEPKVDPDPKDGTFGARMTNVAQRGVRDIDQMTTSQRLQMAVFHSVSARTAGFNTVDLAQLGNAGKFWLCVLMSIGGSPAGTAGGFKTVTFVLLVWTMYSMLRRREEVEIGRRSISDELVRRAVAVVLLYIAWVSLITVVLCVFMPDIPFIDLLFEVCSACGTVGLSTGVTPMLTLAGKIGIMLGMFVGRLGPLTLALAFAWRVRVVKYSYPAETVVIG